MVHEQFLLSEVKKAATAAVIAESVEMLYGCEMRRTLAKMRILIDSHISISASVVRAAVACEPVKCHMRF